MADQVIPEIVKIAVDERVQVLAIAGDLFDGGGRTSLEHCAKLLQKPFQELLGRGINIVVIPGNHDQLQLFEVLRAALNINPPRSDARLEIFTRPGVRAIGDVQVVGMPYLTYRQLDDILRAEGTPITADTDLRSPDLAWVYANVIQALKKPEKLNPERPAVLLGHFAVTGAQYVSSNGPDEPYPGYEANYVDLTVNRDELLNNDQVPQYNALGHMHNAQQVPETTVPTYYSGAPDRFDKRDAKREPQVLLIDVPDRGRVVVQSRPVTCATPAINEAISSSEGLRALATRLGDEGCRRVIGDLAIEVANPGDFDLLCQEAFSLFPRLAEAGAVQPRLPGAAATKFEDTESYTRIENPRAVVAHYLAEAYKAEPRRPYLTAALDKIMETLNAQGGQQ